MNMKKYTVDVHWDFARSYEVEADSREAAERKVEEMMLADGFDPLRNGFEKLEDFEVACSGESNERGEMEYF